MLVDCKAPLYSGMAVLRRQLYIVDIIIIIRPILGSVAWLAPVVRVLAWGSVHCVCRLSIPRILLKYFEELVAGYGCFADGAFAFEKLQPSTVL